MRPVEVSDADCAAFPPLCWAATSHQTVCARVVGYMVVVIVVVGVVVATKSGEGVSVEEGEDGKTESRCEIRAKIKNGTDYLQEACLNDQLVTYLLLLQRPSSQDVCAWLWCEVKQEYGTKPSQVTPVREAMKIH